MSFFGENIRQQCDLALPDAMFARMEWMACPWKNGCFKLTLNSQGEIMILRLASILSIVTD